MSDHKPHIQILIGSSRPNRAGQTIAEWFYTQTAERQDMTFELIDLAEVNLPMFDEPRSPMLDQYEHEHTKEWSKRISKADGYIWITPEYNHSTSAVLKNAIDYLNKEWKHKPVAFVGYGVLGASRAVEHLIGIANELRMVSVRDRVHIIDAYKSVDENGQVEPGSLRGDPQTMLDELKWWTDITVPAR